MIRRLNAAGWGFRSACWSSRSSSRMRSRHEPGFTPAGWATFFVTRPERENKPFGVYSGGPGVSFSFDPFYSDPSDPLWQEFSAWVQPTRSPYTGHERVADADAVATPRRCDNSEEAQPSAVQHGLLRAVSRLGLWTDRNWRRLRAAK
jgi:hypothetical protein